MAQVQHRDTGADDTRWIVMTVRLPLALALDGTRRDERALLIRTLDGWLKTHHHRVALPNAGDGLRGDGLAVSFRREQAERAMAFRVLCGKLGLIATMKQFRVRPNNCARTTPPPGTPPRPRARA